MKKLFFRCIGLIPFIALCTCAFAQDNESGLATIDSKWGLSKGMHVGEAPASSINAKAIKNFNKNYNKPAGWFVIEDGFLAQFIEDDVTTKVYYDRKGNKTASVRSYFENKLPRDIRHMVKSQYYDFNIFYVLEVTVGEKTAFLVKIEDAQTFKTVRVLDGAMDEIEAFTKSK